ncbi:Right handed beta helix region [Halomicrobium zhouii]|uniref:Right handed beta helix region n=1 Tax=Halomicrobium zhouii TaxID=767519 RepID=A0A1I6KFJ3_9EURY|nr:right-handed parallel beta-helix repeat-containing protein [Halomicrobium zhouii]SFR89999.1 Right handed beta helix region [Halomicrobium zhouii]
MDRTRSTVVAVAVLLTTAIAAPALVGTVAAQGQGQQIGECTTIDESGTYELNGSIGVNDSANASAVSDDGSTDVVATSGDSNETSLPNETGVVAADANTSACLAVEASDVTLDGNGYTVDGSDASALNLTGNGTANATNVSDNATVSDGANASADVNESVVNGIVVRPGTENGTVSNVTISNVTVQHWYVGVYVQDAQDVTLDNVTLANNTVPGFRLDNSTGLSIQNVNRNTTR